MKFKLILLVITVYCLTLLSNLPATVVTAFIPAGSIQLQGVSGSAWQGQASAIKINKDVTLKNVDWQVDWSALLSLSIDINLSFDNGADMSGKGVVGYGLSGGKASNVMLDITSETLLKLLPMSLPVDLSGDFSASIQEITEGKPYCEQLKGLVVWNKAMVYSPVGNVDLDSPSAKLSCKGGNIVVNIEQKSTQMESQLGVMLSDGGKYQLSGEIKGTSELAPSIAQSLTWIGPKNENGATNINFNGVL